MKPMVAVMPFPVPELFTGPGSVRRLPEKVRSKGINNVFVVTDKGVRAAGLLEGMCKALDDEKISYTICDEVEPNPSIQNVEEALKLYIANRCEGIVAFGGGSPMDCAKLVGARFRNPKRTVRAMKGMFKVRKKLPPFFAVPTTAGTGSETTLAAVISDRETHEKFAVVDLRLIPDVAILDPELMLGLPPHITAATGMDALTHAVEAYIGLHGTKFTDQNAEQATRLIFENLEEVYRDGSDVERRNNMALASFYAGSAFTRASVGYVHAVAHNMGGLYGVPHGLANAIILPRVLEFCRKEAEEKLARLARAGGIAGGSDSNEQLSHRFIEKVETMNRNMQIPATIQELQAKDIPLIAERALKEANPAYPVPRIMRRNECEELVRKLLP
jgi:alcohol dehydrogenase class IV